MPRVTGVLEELGADWVLAGAVAAAEYRAEPRFTTDLDLLVTWVDRLPEACAAAGYAVRVIRSGDDDPHLVVLSDGSERVERRGTSMRSGSASRLEDAACQEWPRSQAPAQRPIGLAWNEA